MALMMAAAACGGGGDDAADTTAVPASQETSEATNAAEAPTETETTAQSEEDPASTEAPPADEGADAAVAEAPATDAPISWDGGDPVAAVEARMDELSALVGQPLSVDAVAPVMAISADFPYLSGTIAGVMRTFDVDARDGRIEEQRIVSIAERYSADEWDALADSLDPEGEGWRRNSTQRQDFLTDLYTTPAGGRLVLSSKAELEDTEAGVTYKDEYLPDSVEAPAWIASLPVLEGGTVVEIVEAFGPVNDFSWRADGGSIVYRVEYPADRLPDLEAFGQSGILQEAGFDTDEVGLFALADARINLSRGDWEGQFLISSFSVGDLDPAGYHMLWSLTRVAG